MSYHLSTMEQVEDQSSVATMGCGFVVWNFRSSSNVMVHYLVFPHVGWTKLLNQNVEDRV